MVGVLLLAEVAVTLVWQEPLSALSSRAGAETSSASGCARPSRPRSRRRPDSLRAGNDARRRARAPLQASGGTRRSAGPDPDPEAGPELRVRRGSVGRRAEEGPGHYLPTALPGERGTVGIAGHRTTYLAPFRHIDELERGDEIVIRMPYGRFRYSVEGSLVVSPTNTTRAAPRAIRPARAHDLHAAVQRGEAADRDGAAALVAAALALLPKTPTTVIPPPPKGDRITAASPKWFQAGLRMLARWVALAIHALSTTAGDCLGFHQ